MKINYKIVALIAGFSLLVAVAGMLTFSSFKQIETSAEARKNTFIVLNQADEMLSALKDAETGQRGYLLTGDELFLQPYSAVRNRISAQLKDLRTRTLNGAARKHLDTIVPLVDAKMAEMSHVITLRKNSDMTAVTDAVKSGEGKQLMDSIRAGMRSFMQTEEIELAKHDAEFQSKMQRMFSNILYICLLLLLFVFLFAYLIFRHGQQQLKDKVHMETEYLLKIQENTNKQLQQTNDELEIAGETAEKLLSELEIAQIEMEGQNTELKRSQHELETQQIELELQNEELGRVQTESEITMKLLRDSEEQLSVTLNSIGDAVIATDASARVTRMNPVAELLTGWTLAEAIDKQIDEIFHIINKDTRKPSPIPVMDTITHGKIHGLANHTVLIAKDGSECDIADSCAPIRNLDNQVVGAVLVFRDVSAEYAVQQSLHDSAELVKTVLNTVPDGIITIHAKGGIIETVNPAAELIFGYTEAELDGQNFSLLIPELDQDQRNGSLEYDSASEEARVIGLGREVMGQRRDGGFFPLEIAVNEMYLGGQRYFTGILRDISARKLAEEALLKAGALQNAIFNSANFSSIATDAKGVIQIFNVGAERMLGYAATEVMNKITPADISDPHELVARAISLSVELETTINPGFDALVFKASRGIEDIYELTYIRKDGSRFPAVVSVTALRDAQDSIIGYLLIGTDNTARKLIETEQKLLDQRLRDQQFYTRTLFECNIDAIMTTDTTGIITDVNRQMEMLTDCSRDELIGAPLKSYFTDPVRAEKSIKQVLREKKVTNFELTALARDGRETVVSLNATTFYDRDRKLQGVFAAARDVTERKILDLELESARFVAEKANLAKSDFLSSMSHELRTPLGAILGFAQLLESSAPQPSPSQKRSIDQILKAGWYLLELINEILDLALIESGKLSLSLEPLSLSEVLRECEVMIEPQAQQRGISIVFTRLETPFFVNADRTRVKQLLINLLSNSIKYNRVDGTVTVNCTLSPPDAVRISVRDTGAGLNSEELAQLFQPFNRLGQTDIEEGTGIGLVVCKRLVELMDGVIGVESTVGEGSVFWIELKRTEKPDVALDSDEFISTLDADSQSPAQQYTLLYVEDNPANLMLVEDLISRRPDILLLSAREAVSGIALARASLPDVILMDINLPGISGIDALKILAEDPLTSHIPVVALSANAIPHDIQKGLEAGFYRYLTKPIKVNEFMNTIDMTLKYSKKEIK